MIQFLGFIMALFSTMVLIPPLVFIANKLGFVDVPNYRKVHSGEIPRIGGVAFFVGALVPVLLWAHLSNELVSYLLGAFIIVVFGLIDDRFELGFKVKLVGQIIGCSVVILYGGIVIQDMPSFMGGQDLSPFISFPLTLFMIVAVTNAVNFSDGLDGLAGGVVLVTLLVISLMAFENEQTSIALICVALTGAVLGFLQFNSHPATIFMGDTGSQFLGFTVAVLSIWITQAEYGAYAASVPLLLVGLPLLDIVVVTFNRKLDGKSPFAPDKTHFHHRMLSLGLDHLEAVMVVYVFQVLLVVGGYFLRFSSDAFIVGVFSLVLLVYLMVIRRTTALRQWFRPRSLEIGDSLFSKKINYLRKEGGFSKLACMTSVCFIAGYYVYGLVITSPINTIYGVLALGLFFSILIFRIFAKNSFTEWYERIAYYGVACALVFLVEPLVGDSKNLLMFFIALGAVVFVGMHYTKDVRVNVKPLDFLVLLIVLVIPKVFSILGLDERYAFSAFYLLILFYAVELLLVTSTYYCGKQIYIKVGLIAPLLVLGLRSVFSV